MSARGRGCHLWGCWSPQHHTDLGTCQPELTIREPRELFLFLPPLFFFYVVKYTWRGTFRPTHFDPHSSAALGTVMSLSGHHHGPPQRCVALPS